MAFVTLTPDVITAIHRLRATDLTIVEIAGIVRVPYGVVRNVLTGPMWPKLITRVHADGSWEITKVEFGSREIRTPPRG